MAITSSGSVLNPNQVPVVVNVFGGADKDAIVSVTLNEAPVSNTHINNGYIDIGINREPSSYIYRAFAKLNGLDDMSFPCELRPNTNADTCIVRVLINGKMATSNSKIIVESFWKKGENPKGVLATLNFELSAQTSMA